MLTLLGSPALVGLPFTSQCDGADSGGAGTLASSLTNKIANLFEPHFSHMRNVTGFRPGPPPYTEVFSAVAYRMVVAFGGDGEWSALSLLWQPSLAIPSKRSV